MGILKALLVRIGNMLLGIIRVLRKIICCRRRKPEYLLPITIEHIGDIEQNKENELQSWNVWNDNESTSIAQSEDDHGKKSANPEHSDQEDFFKDMVPQIKKSKKIYVRDIREENIQARAHTSRLAMDPKAILASPDLGLIDENPSNWEDSENMEELMPWDPDAVIREKKRAEREKRLAEHQKRKQEKENRRATKPELAINRGLFTMSDSKDKTKFS